MSPTNGSGILIVGALLLGAGCSRTVYSTYLPGGGDDRGYDVAVAPDGSVLVAGYTTSNDYPLKDSIQPKMTSADGTLTVLSPDGDSLTFSTLLGGDGSDEVKAVALDPNGDVILAGFTDSDDFGGAASSPIQNRRAGGIDVFAMKVDVTNRAIVWATYLGGSEEDIASDVAVDSSGNVFVVGKTISSNFPTVGRGIAGSVTGSTTASSGFVARIRHDGGALEYSTILGGSASDEPFGVTVDAAGAAIVTGQTSSSDFPTKHPRPQQMKGPRDAFVTRLAPDGASLVFSMYFGGSETDTAHDIALAPDGTILFAGETTSGDLDPIKPLQDELNGSSDGFVARISGDGRDLLFSTHFGGSGGEIVSAVASAPHGCIAVLGTAFESTDLPVERPIQKEYGGGETDLFVTVIDDSQEESSLVFSTYLGGLGKDSAFRQGLALDAEGDLFITGVTNSGDFPLKHPLFSDYGGGNFDAFATRITGIRY